MSPLKFFKRLVFIWVCLSGLSLMASDLPKDSLYQVEDTWLTQDNKPVELKDFKGQAVIVSMAYTSCQYSCPLIIQKMQEVETALKKAGLQDYHFVVASFDLERDRPAKLKTYLQKKNLDPAHWTLLSAKNESEIRELAVLLDVNFQKLDNGDFSHSNSVTLLDPQGRISKRLKGLSAPPMDFVEKVKSYEKN